MVAIAALGAVGVTVATVRPAQLRTSAAWGFVAGVFGGSVAGAFGIFVLLVGAAAGVAVAALGAFAVGVLCSGYRRRIQARSGASLVALPRPRLAGLALALVLVAFSGAFAFYVKAAAAPEEQAAVPPEQGDRDWESWVVAADGNAVVRYLVLIFALSVLGITFRWFRIETNAAWPKSIEVTVAEIADGADQPGTVGAWPKSIEVSLAKIEKGDAGPENCEAEVCPQEVEAELCKALDSLRLFGPSKVPGESSEQRFVMAAASADSGLTGFPLVLATAAAFLRGRSYRVSGMILTDSPGGGKRLTIEVFDPRGRGGGLATITADDWPAVASRASHHIAAFVLPRTRRARKAPWTPWHGTRIRPKLFEAFHEARILASEGRLEEAMARFDAAVKLDPHNPYIRIERAAVLDELGLHVDALAALVDVVTLESWWDRRLWKRFRELVGDGWRRRPRLLSGSPNGRDALQLARFRMVGSLAASQRIARQWHDHREQLRSATGINIDQPLRHAEVSRALDGLRPLLGKYAEAMVVSHGHRVRGRINSEDVESSKAVLCRVLQFIALQESRAEKGLRLGRLPSSAGHADQPDDGPFDGAVGGPAVPVRRDRPG